MTIITAHIPVGASAKFIMEKPEDWDSLSKSDQFDYFLDHAETAGGLCHHCANHIETDLEPLFNVKHTDIEFYEKKK